MYDAVFVPGGSEHGATLAQQGEMRRFVTEAYRHGKAVAAIGSGVELLGQAGIPARNAGEAQALEHQGVVISPETRDLGAFGERFVAAIAQHRHWSRAE